MIDLFLHVLTSFILHNYHGIKLQAPKEADAELAQLNRPKFVDTVLSDDGDVAVFGACRII
jgi:5'-3' exonuclease